MPRHCTTCCSRPEPDMADRRDKIGELRPEWGIRAALVFLFPKS